MKMDWGVETDEATPAAWLDDDSAHGSQARPPRVADLVVAFSLIAIVCTLIARAAVELLFS
jgi:hypothetical protein